VLCCVEEGTDCVSVLAGSQDSMSFSPHFFCNSNGLCNKKKNRIISQICESVTLI